MKNLPVFSDIQYTKPDFEAWQAELDRLADEAESAADYAELRGVIDRWNRLNAPGMLNCAVAFIRCYLDSSDAFYAGEMQQTAMGSAMLDDSRLISAIINSRFAPELDAELGDNYRILLGDSFRLSSQRKDLQAKEQELVARYQQMKATIRIPFRGRELSEGEMGSMLNSTDRDTRREASAAIASVYADKADEFAPLLDELIKLRTELAKVNGFDSYMDYANLGKGRRSYGQKELLDFCRQVKDSFVPLQEKLAEKQREMLGLDTLCTYDRPLTFPDGNAKPVGDGPVLLESAKGMYDAMDAEAAELYRTMADKGYIDVSSSPNKISNMGFCELLSELNFPYIFGNCTGSIHDAAVLTHEFGHAYNLWLCANNQPVPQYYFLPNDVVEIPSKTMEQLTAPYAKLFFGDTADKFAYHHMKYTVEEICSFCSDHVFESWLYEHPEATTAERIAKKTEITRQYSPKAVDNSELRPYLEKGSALWMSMPVFMFPAYVISYALSDICALEFREQAQRDFAEAWKNYRALCAAGGSYGYDELMSLAKLPTAYAEGSAKRAAETAAKALGLANS